MTDKLTQSARCALAELMWQFYESGLPTPAKRTIIELYNALESKGEDLIDYKEDFRIVVADMTEKVSR